jgi:hypothetical protein
MSTPTTEPAGTFPPGCRYVQYGVLKSTKNHILAAEPRPREDGMTRSNDYDAVCGATAAGRSVCTATRDVLAEVGWLDDNHVCKRCIAVVRASTT